MPPTVSRPSRTLCAPSHMIAAVPVAVPSPTSTLKVTADPGRDVGGADDLVGGGDERAIGSRLLAEGLHHRQRGQRPLDHLEDPRLGFLLRVAALEHRRHVAAQHQHQPRRHRQRHQREARLQPPHHHEHRDEADERGDERQHRVLDDHRHAAAVGGDAADRVADRSPAVEAQRQPLQVAEQVGGQVVDHPLAEADVGVGGGDAERPAHQEQDDRGGRRTSRSGPRACRRRAASPPGWPAPASAGGR